MGKKGKKVRFGIIGCGIIADSHGAAIEFVEDAQLVAVCDIIDDRMNKFTDKYGAAKKYCDYKEMLNDPQIDAVSICTPSGMHGEMAINAARAGKHIFCEKPIEITGEKIDNMIAEVEKSGVKMGCVFQRRTFAESIAVKKALDEGKFGKIILADAYLKYYRSTEYYASADWRATWELDGGGSLMNQGVHGIDLITWLAGDVQSVFARASALRHDIDVEDTAVAVVKYKNGALGVIEGTTSVYPGQSTRFELHCENGTIIFGDEGIQQWELKDNPGEKAPELLKNNISIKDDPQKLMNTSHAALMEDFVDSINSDRDPLITPRIARKSVDLILAIYESAKTGKEVWL
ncbi:MAG: Gfo/Idh/MocA family protein [Christensenellales bacterium]|jgi:UDP-N-acetyl-2-amino-2-deoxyglucuronate dehydrogenase